MPELLDELSMDKATGTFPKVTKDYQKSDFFILGEWLICCLAPREIYNLLEIMEARVNSKNGSMFFVRSTQLKNGMHASTRMLMKVVRFQKQLWIALSAMHMTSLSKVVSQYAKVMNRQPLQKEEPMKDKCPFRASGW